MQDSFKVQYCSAILLTSLFSQRLFKNFSAILSEFPLPRKVIPFCPEFARWTPTCMWFAARSSTYCSLHVLHMWFENRICVQRIWDMLLMLAYDTGTAEWLWAHAVCVVRVYRCPKPWFRRVSEHWMKTVFPTSCIFFSIRERGIQIHFSLNCAEDCDWPSLLFLFVTDVTQKYSEYCLSGQGNKRKRAKILTRK